jgi:hypothetical protein
MNKRIFNIAVFIVFTGVIFFLFAFANWDMNPGHWPTWSRFLFIIIEIYGFNRLPE